MALCAFIIPLLFTMIQPLHAGLGCGIQAPQFQPTGTSRIVGGQEATPHSWPWMISQNANSGFLWWTRPGQDFCGGTLIRVREDVDASDVVLTAAHCINSNKMWLASAGVHKQSDIKNAVTRKIVMAVKHEKYIDFLKDDIALLKLDKPIQFDEKIRPICLPKQADPDPIGKMCVSAGWGLSNRAGEPIQSADALQQTQSPIHPGNICDRAWRTLFTENHICAGDLSGNSATCQGDSGGPLFCRSDDGNWVQYGIVSFGAAQQCATKNVPPVYTKISQYADWIQTTIRKISSL